MVVRSGSCPLESSVDVPLLCDIQSYGHCFEFVKTFSVESGDASQIKPVDAPCMETFISACKANKSGEAHIQREIGIVLCCVCSPSFAFMCVFAAPTTPFQCPFRLTEEIEAPLETRVGGKPAQAEGEKEKKWACPNKNGEKRAHIISLLFGPPHQVFDCVIVGMGNSQGKEIRTSRMAVRIKDLFYEG